MSDTGIPFKLSLLEGAKSKRGFDREMKFELQPFAT
jgi:hypothetical protein